MTRILTEPTTKQLEVLRVIYQGQRSGRVPAVREMCERFHVRSTNAIADVLKALTKKGLISKEATKSRSLSVTPLGLVFLGQHIRRCELCGSEVFANV